MSEKIKKIVDSICDYNYSGDNDEESRDKEEAAIIIENDQLKPFSDTATDQSKLTVVVKKKKTSTLTLILMNELTWLLISFLFLK